MSCYARIWCGLALLLITACAAPSEPVVNPATTPAPPVAPPPEPAPLATPERADIEMAGVPFVVSAPLGFCIDPGAVQVAETSAFIVMGDCDGYVSTRAASFSAGHLSPDARRIQSPFEGVMSVSAVSSSPFAGWSDAERTSVLQEMVQAGLGAELLGRTAITDPEEVRVVATKIRDDTLYVLLEDRPRGSFSYAHPRYWRAFAQEGERMVVLTVSALGPLYPGDQVLLRTIASMRDTIRRDNRTDT